MLLAQDKTKTVAVLFGGRSSEHEISLRSAVYVLKNMPNGWRMIPVAITREGKFFSMEGTFTASQFQKCTAEDLMGLMKGEVSASLPKANVVDSIILPMPASQIESLSESPLRILNLESGVFFPVLHGPNGEDGRIQGLFEMAEVAYVGNEIRASVVGIDKDLQKRLAREAGVLVARYVPIEKEQWTKAKSTVLQKVTSEIGLPAFVKPNALGSAVGCGIANTLAELEALVDASLRFDCKALVEEPMQGTEVECAFLGTSTSPKISVAGEVAPKGFYTYENKYLNEDGADIFIPARLSEVRMQELRKTAAKVAEVLGLRGLSRIDFWNCTNPERFVFNEVNTLPGLTSISQFPMLWKHDGVSAQQWIEEVLQLALTGCQERSARSVGIS